MITAMIDRSGTMPGDGPFGASVRVDERGATTVVHVSGEIDMNTAGLLADALAPIAQRRAGRVVVDLSETSFLDSAGLRTITRARSRMEDAGRWLVTRGATGQPRRLLELARLQFGLEL